jgi:hypothetical protein
MKKNTEYNVYTSLTFILFLYDQEIGFVSQEFFPPREAMNNMGRLFGGFSMFKLFPEFFQTDFKSMHPRRNVQLYAILILQTSEYVAL